MRLEESGSFGQAEHEVEVLKGLTGRALDQVVDGGDDDGAAIGGVDDPAEVAEIGAVDGGQVGNLSGIIETDEGLVPVSGFVDGKEIGRLVEADVDGFENAAVSGNQLRGERELRLGKTGVLEDFRDMAVMEDRVGREVLGRFAEVSLEGGLAAGAGDAGLGVADDAGGEIEDPGLDEGTESEIGGGGVAAGIGDEAGAADLVAVELGKTVDGGGEQVRGDGRFFIPALVDIGSAEAEGTGEVDDAEAGVEEGGGQIDGDFVRSGEEDGGELVARGGGGSGFEAEGAGVSARAGTVSGVRAMVEQDGFAIGMVREKADEFGPGVAAKADDAHTERHG